jgi:hypothetical protein
VTVVPVLVNGACKPAPKLEVLTPPTVTAADLKTFYNTLAPSSYLNWVQRQYHLASLAVAPVVTITVAQPSCAPSSFTDQQIRNLLTAETAAGQPLATTQGTANTIFALHFPATLVPVQPPPPASPPLCNSGAFCAYNFAPGGTSLHYMVLPDLTTLNAVANCPSTCLMTDDTNFIDNTTRIESHELAEALAVGWQGTLNAGVGIGDLCQFDPKTGAVDLATTTVLSGGVRVQKLWSNVANSCGDVAPGAAADFQADGTSAIVLTGNTGENAQGITIATSRFGNRSSTFIKPAPIAVDLGAGSPWSAFELQSGMVPLVGDFDGDGQADLALLGAPNRTTTPVAFTRVGHPSQSTSGGDATLAALAAQHPLEPVTGDFNGDGLTDIAMIGGVGWNFIAVAFSQSQTTLGSFVTVKVPDGGLNAQIAASATRPQLVAGDFDGDGFTDLAVVGLTTFVNGSLTANPSVPVAYSSTAPGTTTAAFNVIVPPVQTTVNGTASGFLNLIVGQLSTPVNATKAIAGDFDGDGFADIAVLGGQAASAPGAIPIAYGRNANASTRSFAVAFFSSTDNASLQNAASVEGAQVLAGDYDGDGLCDLAVVGGQLQSSIAIGFSKPNGALGDLQFLADTAGLSAFTSIAQSPDVQASSAARQTNDRFRALSLLNGWTAAPFNTAPPAVAKISGIAHLQGAIAGGASAQPFVLPPGLRPRGFVSVQVDTFAGNFGTLTIAPDGTVSVRDELSSGFANAKAFTSLEGVSFAVDGTNVTPLSLINGWSTATAGNLAPAVMNDDGTVRFEGAIATTGTNQTPFVLPTAFRPTGHVLLPLTLGSGKKGQLEVHVDGTVFVTQEGGGFSNAQAFTSLDGASFLLINDGNMNLTLQNNWVDTPSGTRHATVRLDNGIVSLKGAVALNPGSPFTSPVFTTLPVGFRPTQSVFANVDLCGGAKGRLDITPDGQVQIQSGHTLADPNCLTSIEGVTFGLNR